MTIKVTNFGGLVPKASPRALPGNSAQVASDLQADTSEFRPLAADAVAVAASGVNNPKTIHRLARKADGSFNTDMSAGWIVRAGEMSFQKAQINDDTTERTYASFDDGSAPPRVYDASDLVTGRLLGVPRPATAPELVVTVNDQYDSANRSGAVTAALTFIKNSIAESLQPVWRGAASADSATYRPGGTHPGYVDRDYIPGLDPEEGHQLRVFRLSSTGGAFNGGISDTYDPLNGPAAYQWALDPAVWGFYQTSPSAGSGYSWPPWAGENQDHWCVPFYAYGLTFDVNFEALAAKLTSMEKPGQDTVTPLFTAEQVSDMIAVATAVSSQQWDEASPKLATLKAQVTTIKTLLTGGAQAQRVVAYSDFYAQTAVAAEISTAIANAAEAIWNLAVQAHAAVSYVDLSPGGGP